MWKLVFIATALCFTASPVGAAGKDGKRIEKIERRDEVGRNDGRRVDTRGDDLRRDVDRISREIYQPRRR